MPKKLISPDDRIYVAGHNGLAGSAVWRKLNEAGYHDLFGARSSEVDLADQKATLEHFQSVKPNVVVLAAARVGGILANKNYPVDFLFENLRIQDNVMKASHAVGVRRLLFLGSSCIYPKFAKQPISEDCLLTGELEPTNSAYAIAKIAGIEGVQAYRRQYGMDWISAMPTNLYGPGDNYDLGNSHVLPALIRKFHEAKITNADEVEVWGTGTPRREFLFSDDLGEACVHLLQNYSCSSPVNVGCGEDTSIRELAELIALSLNYKGRIVFDTSKPDGTPRKLLDVSKIEGSGWTYSTGLKEGIGKAYLDFQNRFVDDGSQA